MKENLDNLFGKNSKFRILDYFTKDIGTANVNDTSYTRHRANLTLLFAGVLTIVSSLNAAWAITLGLEPIGGFNTYMIYIIAAGLLVPISMKVTKNIVVCISILLVVGVTWNYQISQIHSEYTCILVATLCLYPAIAECLTFNIKFSFALTNVIYVIQYLEIESLMGHIVTASDNCITYEQIDEMWHMTAVSVWFFDMLILGLSFVAVTYVNRMSLQLNRLLAKAIQSEKTKEMFIAAVSHELRNPLNSMLGSIEILNCQNLENLTSDQQDLLETMSNCGEILLNLINNVLDITKLQSGNLDLAPGPTDVRAAILKLINVTKQLALSKGLTIEFIASENLPKQIMTDSSRLNQVLINLISNAIKFTGEGSVSIQVDYVPNLSAEHKGQIPIKQELDQGIQNYVRIIPKSLEAVGSFMSYEDDIWQLDEHAYANYIDQHNNEVKNMSIQTDQVFPVSKAEFQLPEIAGYCYYNHEEDGRMKIYVRDTGIGISQEGIQRLFQPFVQANEDICQKFGGTGIGLWLSKTIINLFDGEITIDSVEGEGSNFIISFPVKIVQPLPEKHCSSSTSIESIISQASGCRILLAEDQPFNQNVMAKIIESIEWECMIVSDGQELVEAFMDRHEQVDLILTDFDMPRLDGITAASQIRCFEAQNELRKVPIVVVTGNSSQQTRNLALQAGCNDFLVKPLGREALWQTILKTQFSGQKILIIDDDTLCLGVHEKMISSQGLWVETANNPIDGLNYAMNHWHELSGIIWDQIMPNMYGTELVTKLRQWELKTRKPSIPIIILSGILDSSFKQECLEWNVTDILVKPVPRKTLIESIKTNIIHKSRESRAVINS